MPPTLTRRDWLRAGALGVAGLYGAGLSAGCSSSAAGPGTASYWSGLEGAEVRRYFAGTVASGFTAAYPGEQLAVSYKSSADLERDVRLALAAGTAPDLVETNGPAFVPELAEQGYLADLTDYAAEFGWADDLLSWVPSVGSVDGRLYSIPVQFETLGIFYNATLFDRYGYRPPRDRAELEGLCAELTAQGIVPFAAGNRDFAQMIEWFTSVFFSNYAGPQLMYDVLTGTTPWTTGPMVEAAALLRDYFDRGWFGGGPDRYFTTSLNTAHADLAAGKAAMTMEGTWLFAEIDSFFGAEGGNDNDWAFASFPALRAGVPYPLYPIGTGGSLSINAKSAAPEVAAHFIEYLIGDRAAAAARMGEFTAEFALPLRFTATDLPESMDRRVREAYLDLLAATDRGNIGYTNWTFSAPRTAVHIYEKAQKLITGELSAEDYLAGIQLTYEQDLADGFTPVAIKPKAADG